MRLAACTFAFLSCAVVLGGGAGSARTQGGAAWNLKAVSASQKWLRVSVEGERLYGFSVRGTDFTVTGVKSVRASGGRAPNCSLTAGTLNCVGELPGGISVFVQLGVSGTGGGYELALVFEPGGTNLLYIPSNQTPPPQRLGGSLGKTSETTARVTIHNPSKTLSYTDLEVAPIGFGIRSVTRFSIAKGKRAEGCAVTEGGGAECAGDLGPGDTAVITFVIDPFSGQAFAVLLAHGTDTGFILVPVGDPCADLRAKIAELQAEANALKQQISSTQKELNEAKKALHRAKIYLRGTLLPGENQKKAAQKVADAEKRVKDAESSLPKLKERLDDVEEEIRARQRHLRNCEDGEERKVAVATACDGEGKAAAQAAGKVQGLSAAVPVERRVAAKVAAAIPLLKQVGGRAGPAGRQAIAHLNALVALPGKTQKALDVARGASARANSALADCETSLTQD